MNEEYQQKRFQQPPMWRWHVFNRNDREIRFGSVFPDDGAPDAIILTLQGLREPTEKYFEFAHWCLENNFAFWMMDWMGQGKSGRYLKNPQKRHSAGFDEDLEDFHHMIENYIRYAAVSPKKGKIPLVMLGHSMGGNLGLRYLCRNPEIFSCAAFSAPMTGILAFHYAPQQLGAMAAANMSLLAGESYVPGGSDWPNKNEKLINLSSDPVRVGLQDFWFDHDEELRCGDVTFRWVHEAQKSCIALQNDTALEHIQTPCLFATAGLEELVDNTKTDQIAAIMPNAKVVEYPGAYHEILNEKDSVRNDFLKHFSEHIKENI